MWSWEELGRIFPRQEGPVWRVKTVICIKLKIKQELKRTFYVPKNTAKSSFSASVTAFFWSEEKEKTDLILSAHLTKQMPLKVRSHNKRDLVYTSPFLFWPRQLLRQSGDEIEESAMHEEEEPAKRTGPFLFLMAAKTKKHYKGLHANIHE